MSLFDRTTLTQHETTAIATLMVSREIEGLFENEPVSPEAHLTYLRDVLEVLTEECNARKSIGFFRKRALMVCIFQAVRSLIATVKTDDLRYLSTASQSYSYAILSDIEGCPRELVEWYCAVACELQRARYH
jgi:hypothetical protein